MTDKERQLHIEKLAQELNCALVQALNMAGMMFVEEEPPRIEGPVIIEQKDYLVMLHELGHVAWEHTQGRPPFEDKRFYFENGVLHSEAQAWDWAMENCQEELEDKTRAFMWHFCLGSYYRASIAAAGRPGQRLLNGNRHWVSFTYDEPNDYFWDVVKKICGSVVNLPLARLTQEALQ